MKAEPVLIYRTLASTDEIIATGDNIGEVTKHFNDVDEYISKITEIADNTGGNAEWNHTLRTVAGKIYYTFDDRHDEPVEVVPGKNCVWMCGTTNDGVNIAISAVPEEGDAIYDSFEAAQYALAKKRVEDITEEVHAAVHVIHELKDTIRNIQHEVDEQNKRRKYYQNIINSFE